MSVFNKLAQFQKMVRLVADVHRGAKDLNRVDSAELYFSTYSAIALGLHNSSSLDIGCGAVPKNPFEASSAFGLDIRHSDAPNMKNADLAVQSIPFESCRFEYVTAFDFIEHVPRVVYMPERRFPFVMLMNEIFRILKPNGIFFSRTPFYPFAEAFRDPTHVNIITTETFPLYFGGNRPHAKIYGFIGSFEVVDQARQGSHLVSILRKVV